MFWDLSFQTFFVVCVCDCVWVFVLVYRNPLSFSMGWSCKLLFSVFFFFLSNSTYNRYFPMSVNKLLLASFEGNFFWKLLSWNLTHITSIQLDDCTKWAQPSEPHQVKKQNSSSTPTLYPITVPTSFLRQTWLCAWFPTPYTTLAWFWVLDKCYHIVFAYVGVFGSTFC